MEVPSDAELKLMSEIEIMLENMRWPSRVTRRNIGSDPNRRAFALGRVYRYDRPGQLVESQFNKKYPELFSALKRLVLLHAPTFQFNSIQLNANVHTEPHYDTNNYGPSYAIGLGRFTGGGIVLYPGDRKSVTDVSNPIRLRNKRCWVCFNGATTLHGSIRVKSGTRYAIIFFTRKAPRVSAPHLQSSRVRRRSPRASRRR